MWTESDAAIGELLASKSPWLSGSLDEPNSVSDSWLKHGIEGLPTKLSRRQLFQLVGETRSASSPDWVNAFWHVMAWGVMGNFRNVSGMVASATADRTFAETLAQAAAASFAGDIASAHRMMHRRINRLGPAFFTKYLYFTSDPKATQPRCMILDERVAAAIFTLTGTYFDARDAGEYVEYCGKLHAWAAEFGASRDDLEFRLYRFGQLTGNARWRWLHAEARLYRAAERTGGSLPDVDFEAILAELARAGS